MWKSLEMLVKPYINGKFDMWKTCATSRPACSGKAAPGTRPEASGGVTVCANIPNAAKLKPYGFIVINFKQS